MLYHASPIGGLVVLTPHVSNHGRPLVARLKYMTPNRKIAVPPDPAQSNSELMCPCGCARTSSSDAAVIIVAQRITTIVDAEQIVVLDRGRIVGIGTHDELLATCETYREIAESQLAIGENA